MTIQLETKFKLLSSLEKVFFDMPETIEFVEGSMLKNEIYSFQLAAFATLRTYGVIPCRVEIDSELAPYITMYQVGYVPSLLPAIHFLSDDEYLSKTPCMLPDPMHKVKDGQISLISDQARAIWFEVAPEGKVTGVQPINIRVFDKDNNLLCEKCFTLTVIDAELPKQTVPLTNWFHGDCLAQLHNVEVLSEEYYAIVEKYLETYVRFGHTMILTPVFTPPLDTEIGAERPTNQLVGVRVDAGVYQFDFTHLKRWITLCQSKGITYFEISHLFTQWGAKHAPKVMATVDGEYKRIFGWDTDALSEEYRGFLNAFLPALKDFLQAQGIWEQCYFHVSDEPHEEDEQQYLAVKQILLPYVPKERIMDALSSYSFYEKGIVQTPIVSTTAMDTFMDHGVEDLWTYYCVGQRESVSNRFMALPAYRNRVLGVQLYKNNIQGFLQWGFNFWYTQLSKAVVNPYADTCCGGAYPSGDAFIVYPLDGDGNVVCSTRLYVFNEGLQDMRALQLLEQLTDRQTVMQLLIKYVRFDTFPRGAKLLLRLRKQINKLIADKRSDKHEKDQ